MRVLIVAFLLALTAHAAGASDLKIVSQAVGQTAAERLVVHSERVGRDFQIDAWTPVTRPWLPGQTAAVVYILDGGYGLAGPIAATLGATNAMQPAYVVTVGYPPGKGARETDLLFGPGTRPNGTVAKGGGGEAFTAFLVEELKPFIEARYPADPANAVLMGHSLAGIYTANVLARRPDAFAGYVIASPSLWADPQIVDRLAAARPATPRRVFVAYGGAEAEFMVDGGRRMAKAVAANRAFASRVQVFAGEEHMTYYASLVRPALGHVLPRKSRIDFPDPVKMTPEALARYVGTYRVSPDREVVVALSGGGLTAIRTDRPALPLTASAPDRFFVDGMDIRLDFEGPAAGPATAVVLHMNGDQARGPRAD